MSMVRARRSAACGYLSTYFFWLPLTCLPTHGAKGAVVWYTNHDYPSHYVAYEPRLPPPLRPASRGQRGLPHLLQRGRTAAHVAPHALARPGATSRVRRPPCWRNASLALAPSGGHLGLPLPASWVRVRVRVRARARAWVRARARVRVRIGSGSGLGLGLGLPLPGS